MSDDLDDIFGETLEAAAPRSFNPYENRQPVEERMLWQTVEYSLVFLRVKCTHCGTVSTAPEGAYEKQIHARNKCESLVRTAYAATAIDHPRTLHFIDRESPFCMACVYSQGILSC